MSAKEKQPTMVCLGYGEEVIHYDDHSQQYTRGHVDLEAFAEEHDLPLVDVKGSVERGDVALLRLLMLGPLLDASRYAPIKDDYGPYDCAPASIHLALHELVGVRVVWRKAEPYREEALEVARKIFARIFPGEAKGEAA